MGLASRRGKLKQHSVMSPRINSSACTACGLCIQWCPQDTISWRDEKAYINEENCIGCGECLTVCKYGAVMFDWGRESADMQEMMAEHTAGVIRTVKGRVFFFNFLINITRSCDCDSGETPLCRDVGIVAGEDIVAVEKACHDIFYKKNGSRFQDITWPRINPFLQIEHAQNLGLGTTEYNLMELNEVLI
jgi:uncharacterized Fe-S center protein